MNQQTLSNYSQGITDVMKADLETKDQMFPPIFLFPSPCGCYPYYFQGTNAAIHVRKII